MVVITKRGLIANVAHRWRATYQRRDEWLPAPHQTATSNIYTALLALSADATEAQVVEITGDDRWTQNRCHECGVDSDVIVGFAQEPHHPTGTTYICVACLTQALTLATEVSK